ncbi:hypothetical protein [Arthrobacter monumenti]
MPVAISDAQGGALRPATTADRMVRSSHSDGQGSGSSLSFSPLLGVKKWAQTVLSHNSGLESGLNVGRAGQVGRQRLALELGG